MKDLKNRRIDRRMSLFAETVLRLFSSIDRTNRVDKEIEWTQSSDENEELAEEFKSMSMFAFALVVISFHIEIVRTSLNLFQTYKTNADNSYEILFRSQEVQTYFTHFSLFYSTYLSLYNLSIVFIVWLTVQYVLQLYWRRHELTEWMTKYVFICAKGLILGYLWLFLIVWTFVDSDVLEIYYSEIRSGRQLLLLNKQFFQLAVLFFVSSVSIRYCLLVEHAVKHFRLQIEYFGRIVDNLY